MAKEEGILVVQTMRVLLRRPDAHFRDLNSWNWKKCRPGGWGNASLRIKKGRAERDSWAGYYGVQE